ncbi:MAG: cell division protein FtsW, partial [Planktomarina sp.]
MTEMVYGSVPVSRGEPVFSKWWRTVDKWTLSSVFLLFSIGILLGFAASPPLAEKNGFSPFHYVERQMIYGTIGLTAMVIGSMLPIRLIRRLGVLG